MKTVLSYSVPKFDLADLDKCRIDPTLKGSGTHMDSNSLAHVLHAFVSCVLYRLSYGAVPKVVWMFHLRTNGHLLK